MASLPRSPLHPSDDASSLACLLLLQRRQWRAGNLLLGATTSACCGALRLAYCGGASGTGAAAAGAASGACGGARKPPSPPVGLLPRGLLALMLPSPPGAMSLGEAPLPLLPPTRAKPSPRNALTLGGPGAQCKRPPAAPLGRRWNCCPTAPSGIAEERPNRWYCAASLLCSAWACSASWCSWWAAACGCANPTAPHGPAPPGCSPAAPGASHMADKGPADCAPPPPEGSPPPA